MFACIHNGTVHQKMISVMSDNISHPQITRLKRLFVTTLFLDVLCAFWLYWQLGHPWGWHVVTMDGENAFNLTHAASLIQFILFAASADLFLRYRVAVFNLKSSQYTLPLLVSQFASVLIYGLTALAAFALLREQSLTHLLTASGAIGLTISYAAKDMIADVLASIEIQMDRLFGIGDWIELRSAPLDGIFCVVEFDRRMVTLRNYAGMTFKVQNRRLANSTILNLTRQSTNHKRRKEIQIDARYSPEKVIPVLETALQYVSINQKGFGPYYACFVHGMQVGSVTYVVRYACPPSMHIDVSSGIVLQAVCRFLAAASISMELSTKFERSVLTDDRVRRLMDVRHQGLLRVMSMPEITQLALQASLIKVPANDVLIHQGDQGQSMYIVLEGRLQVDVPDGSGGWVNVSSLWPGECVGEMSLLTGAPRSANVTALTEVLVLEISKDNLAPILKANPKLIDLISSILVERTAHNQRILQSDQSSSVEVSKREGMASMIFSFFGLK